MTFYIGFALSIIGLIVATRKTLRGKNILSPQMLIFIALLLFIYIPAVMQQSSHITDERYNFILLASVIGAYIPLYFCSFSVLEKSTYSYTPKIKVFKWFAYIYVAYLLYGIAKAIISYGSISAVFSANRVQNYLTEGLIDSSSTFLLITSALKIFFYFYIDYLFETKQNLKGIFLFAIPMVHHRFTAVTRYDFVAMAATLVLFIIDSRLYRTEKAVEVKEQKKKPPIMRFAIIGLLLLYAAMIFMEASNLTRIGLSISQYKGSLSFSSIFIHIVSNDAEYYDFLYNLYEKIHSGNMGFEYGASYLFYPIINFIPRAIWPGKPYTSFSNRATELVYWSLSSGKPVVTFTIFGEGFAQFGIIGCLICSYIFVKTRWININQAKKMRYNRLFIIMMLFSMFTYIRGSIPIFYVIIDGIWLWFIRKTCTTKNVD